MTPAATAVAAVSGAASSASSSAAAEATANFGARLDVGSAASVLGGAMLVVHVWT